MLTKDPVERAPNSGNGGQNRVDFYKMGKKVELCERKQSAMKGFEDKAPRPPSQQL